MIHYIPYADFLRLLTDTTEFSDLDSYIAEYGGSVPLDDARQVVRMLEAIWAMGHDGLTIKSIAAIRERSARSLSRDYGLPTRTLEDWSANRRTPPAWQLPLVAYAVLSDHLSDQMKKKP